MKTQATFLLIFICNVTFIFATDPSIAILREWANYAGNSDSTFKTPIVSDSDYTYVATVSQHAVSGVDITVLKYQIGGDRIWEQTWSGPGNGRDQASDMTEDGTYLYVCGTTFTSSTNNFDLHSIL